jgi:hypothetical protein
VGRCKLLLLLLLGLVVVLYDVNGRHSAERDQELAERGVVAPRLHCGNTWISGLAMGVAACGFDWRCLVGRANTSVGCCAGLVVSSAVVAASRIAQG